MANMNLVVLAGNLTRDPELRATPGGTAVANLGLAVNRTWVDAAGEKHEEAAFITVVVWGKQAETCGEYLKRGAPVLVEGRLQSRSWETDDGAKRSVLEVVAGRVQFLGRKEGA